MNSKTIIIIAATSILCFMSYFCKAQTQPNVPDSVAIIGTWVSENDPTHKLVFTSNGRMEEYHNNSFEGYFLYSLIKTCNGQTSSNINNVYLKLKDPQDGEIFCHVLNGIRTGTNNITTLSITLERGKLCLYTKQ